MPEWLFAFIALLPF